MKKRILTGDRPTGKLHIGHYLGSLQNRVALQDEYDQYIIIADVQALTDNYDNPDKVRENVKEVVSDYLACGIDPEKTTIFLQSMIGEIAELTVFYSNLVTISRLQRNPTIKTEMAQKKELFGNDGESVTYGFLGYPVSQAADRTAFDADLIPVGEDQLPLIEQSREIVRKFNNIYGETLKEPKELLSKFPRVVGLDGNKMSKSLNNAIYLADDDDTILKKVMTATTDPKKIKKDDKADPEVCMVYYYHKMFSKESLPDICKECKAGARGCVACKRELAQNISKVVSPIRERRRYYENHTDEVYEVINKGTAKAREIAKETLRKVKKAMKIDYIDINK